MAEGSLQVDPESLRQAATDLHTHHFRLQEAVSAVWAEYDTLRQLWTGAAADQASSVWQEVRPRLNVHLDRLSGLATSLTTTAATLSGQDNQNATDVAAAASSLDLP